MIYFMQPTDGGPVKIGYTDNLPTRHKQLEVHYRRPLAVLATMDGDLDTEREIHTRFGHLRLSGSKPSRRQPEQFRPGPDLMAFIGRPLLVSPNPDAVEAMQAQRTSKPVRLDLPDAEFERLDRIARSMGLTKASYARMVVIKALDQEAKDRGINR
jgi:Meiotically up-regulated gene 113